MSRCRSLRLLLFLILSVLPACSAIVTYADLASWQANATQAGATIDFSSLAPTQGSGSYFAAITDYPGFVITGPGDSLYAYNPSSGDVWWNWTPLSAIVKSNANLGLGSGAIQIDLSTPVTAFAALVGINNGSPGSWLGSQVTVTASSGGTALGSEVFATAAHPTLTFVGVASDTPGETFNSITLTPALTHLYLDDVRVGSFSASLPPPPTGETPEPGTWILALSGAGLVAVAKLRLFRSRN